MTDETHIRELWDGAFLMLRKNRFTLIVKTRDGQYWKRKDGASVMVTAKANGEPKVVRLDR